MPDPQAKVLLCHVVPLSLVLIIVLAGSLTLAAPLDATPHLHQPLAGAASDVGGHDLNDIVTGTRRSLLNGVDLGLVKRLSSGTALPGALLTYRLDYVNLGAWVDDITITDTLPASLTFSSAHAPAGWRSSSIAPGNVITWSRPWLARLDSGVITMTARVSDTVPLGLELVNQAEIASHQPDIDLSNNTTTHTITAGSVAASFSAAPNPACVQTTITFTGTNNLAPSDAYAWDFGDGSSGWHEHTDHAYLSSGAFTVTMWVIAEGHIDRASSTIEVQPAPIVSFTTSPTLCLGNALNVTNNTTGASTYLWTFGDGTTSPDASPTHTYPDLGVYTVTLEATTTPGCASQMQQQVRVVEDEVSGLTVIGDPMTLLGHSTQFTATLESGSNFTYTWAFSDGTTLNGGPQVEHTYGRTGHYQATVTATSTLKSLTARTEVAVVHRKVDIEPDVPAVLAWADPHGLTTTFEVPSDAVSDRTMLGFTADETADAPPGLTFSAHAFTLEAYQNGAWPAGFTFSAPITITLQYSDQDAGNAKEGTLRLYSWDGVAWIDAACGAYELNPDDNWLRVPICQVGRFALMGQTDRTPIFLPIAIKGN